ncbi:solute carrier family 22 member 13 [Anguilla anguilla]|uniref:solute carrier family 22 member 13 n=1 Tax=Anguilla anguilla TaxID=7936 RepID=UPI0015AA13A5|nr:solute carrier family 22 member 13 [Anguilla anguilla]
MMADFGEILRAVGDFGLFQKCLLAGLLLPTMVLPMHFYSVMFTHAGSFHHCNTDWILEVSPNLTAEEQLNLTLPQGQDGSFKSCEMFTPVDRDIESIRDYGINQTTDCTDGWVYDTSVYKSSIVSEFDLVCDKVNFVGVAQTVFMAGILFGSFIFGPLAESLGRKRAVQIPVVLMAISSVGSALSPNFYVYLAVQFIVGVSYGGYRVNCIILATEWIGMTKRTYPSALCQVFGGIGQSVLAGIAYFIRDWRTAQFVIASPWALVILYIWIIPESARWLLDRGRTEEAEKLILMAAAVNKQKIPDNIMEKVVNNKKGDRGTVTDLFTSPLLRKYFLIIVCSWFSLNLSYYCITLNVGEFGMDIFLTQLIFGLTEIPAQILCAWLMEVLGRKITVAIALLLGGFLSLLLLAVPQENAIAITVFATAGRLSMNMAGTICNVYVQELFPTSIRQTANGLGAMATRAAGMLSPILNMLAVFHRVIPILVYSGLCIFSGALCFLLPETRRKELPDSPEDLEINRDMNIRKNNRSNPDGGTQRSTKL